MSDINRTSLQALPRISNRSTFLYVERCRIHREDAALTISDCRGVAHVPAAQLACLMCGPGTTVTTAAMALISDSGITCVWVGENGIRLYASGRGLASSSRLAEAQAKLVSNRNTHLEVARRMFAMRFEDEDPSRMTMRELRLAEARRVKAEYRTLSQRFGVKWTSRKTKVNADTSDINLALSVGNSCLYGVAHSVIVALGAVPSLGFVHVRHALSFVFDIADLYKSEIAWPIAFKLVSEKSADIAGDMRRQMRDSFRATHIMERIVDDIYSLLLDGHDGNQVGIDFGANVSYIWDDGAVEQVRPQRSEALDEDIPMDALLGTDNGILLDPSAEW